MQSGQTIMKSSESLGWSSLFASHQREAPYRADFNARNMGLVIVHMNGPAEVERYLSGERMQRKVPTGGVFFLPPGRDFGVHLKQDLETVHMYLPMEYLQAAAAELCKGDAEQIEFLPRLGEQDPTIESLARSCCYLLNEQLSDLYADSVSRLLAIQLVRRHSTHQTLSDIDKVGHLSANQLRRVREFIDAHLSHPIGVEDLAKAAGLAPIQFARQFKRASGVTPYQFLIDCRVERARSMLLKPIPIAEIAVACGFTHQEHLTRVFRRVTGVTPGRFRNSSC
jgi:AraC family transcriptional regulator